MTKRKASAGRSAGPRNHPQAEQWSGSANRRATCSTARASAPSGRGRDRDACRRHQTQSLSQFPVEGRARRRLSAPYGRGRNWRGSTRPWRPIRKIRGGAVARLAHRPAGPGEQGRLSRLRHDQCGRRISQPAPSRAQGRERHQIPFSAPGSRRSPRPSARGSPTGWAMRCCCCSKASMPPGNCSVPVDPRARPARSRRCAGRQLLRAGALISPSEW